MKGLKLNLQFFAEGGEGNSDQNAGDNNQGQQNNQQSIDYTKIQNMIDTATAKKENAVLKSYFQQQGLSEDEINQAITAFKQNKQQQNQQQQNDNAELKAQMETAQQLAQQAQIELVATRVAMTLGIDSKTLPYVIKMADFSKANDNEGKISEDNIKSALEQVLTDVPALKPISETNIGFKIGSSGGNNNNQADDEALKKAFGL
jgi:ATP-dependent Clp protease ATP-binding subunit ClpA